MEWVDSCPPNQNAVWSNFNEYANERGFLSETNFTFNERSAIKRVTQKSILNEIDIATVETRGNYPHIFQMKIADVSQKNYSAYQQDVTDKMFLLCVDQICRIYKNKSIFGTDYHLCKPTQKAVDISGYKCRIK